MKRLFAVAITLVAFLALPALAQEWLPPDAANSCPTPAPKAKGDKKGAKKKVKKALVVDKAKQEMAAKIAELQQRLDELEGRVCAGPCHDDDIVALKAQLAAKAKELDVSQAELAALQDRLSDIAYRLQQKPEPTPNPLKLSFGAGAVYLGAITGTCPNLYGALIGPHLALWSGDVALVGDADLFLGGSGQSPLGFHGRVGVGFKTSERGSVEIGANGFWIDVNQQGATWLYPLGDLSYRVKGNETPGFLSVGVLVGPQLGPCGRCFTAGFMFKAGL